MIRTWKPFSTSATVFAHDGGQVALQFDKTGYGSLSGSNLSHRYLWGAAVDQLFADEQVNWSDSDSDGEVLWAMTDTLGSVRDVIDSNGDLRVHRQCDGFGNVVDETHYNTNGGEVSAGQSGYVDEAFAFTGRLFDRDTGVQNNLNRWYDPTIGRWLSEDPIGFAGGDANLYLYVGNAPTTFVDPSGLVAWKPGWVQYPDGTWGPVKILPPPPGFTPNVINNQPSAWGHYANPFHDFRDDVGWQGKALNGGAIAGGVAAVAALRRKEEKGTFYFSR